MELIRLKNELTVIEFTRLIGISPRTYWGYKSARDISPQVEKIVKMIEMSPGVILFLLAKINDKHQVKYLYADEILVELVKMT